MSPTDKHQSKLLYATLTFLLRKICFDIRNTYGPGHKEIIYHRLFEKYLQNNKLSYAKEERIKFCDKEGEIMGIYQPDFVVENKVIIEIKSSRFTSFIYDKQLYYYLRNSIYEVGFLVNFSTPRLYIKRIIYTNDRKPFLSV